jgi:hypothetical protein
LIQARKEEELKVNHPLSALRHTIHHTNRHAYSTGLEAYTTYCKWYPDQNSIPNRNVEGFYILTDMPYIGRNHRGIIQ